MKKPALHLHRLDGARGMAIALCGDIVDIRSGITAPPFATCVACLIEQLRMAQNLATACLVRLAKLERARDVLPDDVA